MIFVLIIIIIFFKEKVKAHGNDNSWNKDEMIKLEWYGSNYTFWNCPPHVDYIHYNTQIKYHMKLNICKS